MNRKDLFFEKYMADVVDEIRFMTEFAPAPIAMTIAIKNAFANEVSILEVLEVLRFCDLFQVLDLIIIVKLPVRFRIFGNQTEDQYDSTWRIEGGSRPHKPG